MIAPHLDFKVLKQSVAIAQVLAAKGLTEHFKKRGDRLIGPCPIHNGDNRSAFVVSLSENLWHCFSRCHAGGDVVELVRRLDGLNYRQTAERLASLASLVPPTASHFQQSGSLAEPLGQPRKRFHPYSRRLLLDPSTPFLLNKGITASTASSFEAGAYHGRGFLDGCIGVRLHDLSGKPLGYAGRRLNGQHASANGKWKFPPRLPKNQILYGYHRLGNPRRLCVVEGPWSVMRLHQIGVPAVALLGAHLSGIQRHVLANASAVTIMLDGDPTGRAASLRVQQALQADIKVHTAALPDNLDPDDLSDQQLKSYLRHLR
ncbi:MAG: toprim domain-containing protein [bacterium]|nr:toprim domain-containing protein [bacterium]